MTNNRPYRPPVGRHQAAARKLRIAARKTPVWKAVAGLADTAVNIGKEVDEWPVSVPGRASALREYLSAMKELTGYIVDAAEPAEDKLADLKRLVRDAGG